MIRKILLTNGVTEKAPCFEMFTEKSLSYRNIEKAYKTLKSSHYGIMDLLSIFDSVLEGIFNVTEITIATLIFTEGLDGYYVEGGEWYRAKYLKINKVDVVYLVDSDELLTNDDFKKSQFDGNDGNRYKLKSTRELKKR